MLYIIPTPVGNLKDITIRALEVLNEVDMIACENPLISLKLLNNYNIKKPLIKYHKFNELHENDKIVKYLNEGKKIALISDAGTPVVSDPGNNLISRLKEEKLEYTCLPGACAMIPALVMSGMDMNTFYFAGFIFGTKSEMIEKLNRLKNIHSLLTFYIAPHDLVHQLDLMYQIFGSKKVAIVREISKIYEQVEDFELGDVYKGETRGEFVVIIDNSEIQNADLELPIKEHLQKYIDMGIEKKDAMKIVAKERGVSKSQIYKNTID